MGPVGQTGFYLGPVSVWVVRSTGRMDPPPMWEMRLVIGWELVYCWHRRASFFLQASFTPRSVSCKHVFPEIYWFSRSCAIIPVILLPYVVLPPFRSSVRCPARPSLPLHRPAGQAFPLHAPLHLAYRRYSDFSATSDIQFVHITFRF